MKTISENIEVQRGGVQTETTFTIKATSKAFDILSSGLYSDKIRAIVRELSCNAYDSHVAAGKADLPIEVKLPTYLDQTFYVKDFGLGLSDEDVNQLYTTYFESTKTNSDDFIGQLGLGSKSPFSYASTFTVESRFNGVKSVYTCFKNESGLPAISKMGEAPTDEVNGVTVALSAKRDDVDKFGEAARKTYMYFDPVPKVLGDSMFTPYSVKHTIKGANWKIRETDYRSRMTKAYVVQGFIAYPVDVTQLTDNGMSRAAAKLANTNLDIYVNIGQVEVAASREALSYDIRTIKNLIGVLEEAAVEMRASFQAEFDTCTSKWDAARKLAEFSHSSSSEFREIFNSMHESTVFMWNGAPVVGNVRLDLSSIANTTIRLMGVSHHGKVGTTGAWMPGTSSKSMDYQIAQKNLHVLVDTEAKGHSELIRQYVQSCHGEKPMVLLISPTSKKTFTQSEVDSIINQLGNPPFVHSADLSVPRSKAVTTYKARTIEEKLVWTGFPEATNSRGNKYKRDTFSRLCWSKQNVTIEDGGYFVDLERFAAIKDGNHLNNLDNIIEHAIALGIVPKNVQVYGMSDRDKKHINDIPEWVDFIDFVKKAFIALNVNDGLYTRCVVNKVKAELGGAVTEFLEHWNNVGALLNDGLFKNYLDKIAQMDKTAPIASWTSVTNLAMYMDVKTTVAKNTDALTVEWYALLKTYSMLSFINWSNVDRTNYTIVIDYINMVDAVKT